MFHVVQKPHTVNGHTHLYTVIDHPGAVTIVPSRANRYGLIRQFRPAIDREILEFPAGTIDPPEPPLACAKRELSEETGLQAGQWIELGNFFLAPGYSSEFMHIFLAEAAEDEPAGAHPESNEEISPVEWWSLAELDAGARDGRIQDAKTLAALFLLHTHLRSHS